MIDLLLTLLIGALVGWLAGRFMNSSYAWWMNILLGIVGGIVGGFLLGSLIPPIINLGPVSLGGIITGVIGAVVVIFIGRLVKK